MKIEFKKIVIDNFMSFGHAECSFENRGCVLVKGENLNESDNAISNGAGKSTLFNALSFALFGETIQGVSSNLTNLFSNGDMSVDLSFSLDEHEFRVIRSRTIAGKSDLKIEIDGTDKSGKGVRESQALLEQYLPDLTAELFGNVILLGQGLPHKFSDHTPSGRKELLEKLTKSDFMIEDLKNRLTSRMEALKDAMAEAERAITALDAKATMLAERIASNKETLNTLDSSQLRANLDTANSELSKTTERKAKLSESLSKLLEEKTKLTERLKERTDSLNSELEKEQTEYSTHRERNVSDKSRLAAEVRELSNRLQKISHELYCPTCGQLLPHKEVIDTSSMKADLADRQKKLAEIEDKLSKQAEAYKLNTQDIKSAYKPEIDDLNEKMAKIDRRPIDAELSDLNAKESSLSLDIGTLQAKLAAIDDRKDEISKQIATDETASANIAMEISYNNKELDRLKAKYDIDNKMLTGAKRDFRGLLLKASIDYIDSKAKEYAKTVFGNDLVSIRLDGNNINIEYADKPLDNLSGGEKRKVDIILQFAIREMMCRQLGFSSNLLVLDEALDNLDKLGSMKIIEFIQNYMSSVDSIFVISHHADELNLDYDSMVVVRKDSSGVSALVE